MKVPTTLNSSSIDRRRWKALGIPNELGEPARRLGDAYLAMGCEEKSFTCAPYLMETAPSAGEHVAWGESNAVIFANSILGARTTKMADYLDIASAIVGLVPAAGVHVDEGRKPTVVLDAAPLLAREEILATAGSAFWPVLGYLVGLVAGSEIPLVIGIGSSSSSSPSSPSSSSDQDVLLLPSRDDLKAFSAAFGTTGAAPLFHIEGVTPEAPVGCERPMHPPPIQLTPDSFSKAWRTLDSGGDGGEGQGEAEDRVDLVALGNPHLSITECAEIARICEELQEHAGGVQTGQGGETPRVIATLGRGVLDEAREKGYAQSMERFGIEFVNDTCEFARFRRNLLRARVGGRARL